MTGVLDQPTPQVAVVIPCFNHGATLGEAVDSVLAQPVLVELVVVDDGSMEPATLAAFDRERERGIHVLRQSNGGLSAARMAGVAATSAPYLLPLDADDRLVPGALERLCAALERDPRAAVAWGAYRVFGDVSYVQATAACLDAWQLSYQNDLPACAMLRRSALLECGGWALDARHGYEDWDLWMTFAERAWRGIGLRDVVYEYRVDGAGLLAQSAARHDEHYELLRARHPALFARRRHAWRASSAPWLLRGALPVIERLPGSRNLKRLLGGVACHVANRRSPRTLLRRLAAAHPGSGA